LFSSGNRELSPKNLTKKLTDDSHALLFDSQLEVQNETEARLYEEVSLKAQMRNNEGR